jgi:hypothetical protein
MRAGVHRGNVTCEMDGSSPHDGSFLLPLVDRVEIRALSGAPAR